MAGHILAIDQGTTSTRAMVLDESRHVVASAQQEFRQILPHSGWVEHDPEDLWDTTLATARDALEKAGLTAGGIAGIGITNQRETTLVWERDTGKPLGNAIVWQDRRTSAMCDRLRADGLEDEVTARTGLLLDPYFSGTKIAWILDQHEGARARAEAGELLFGTVDSYLIWRLTGGRRHVTDVTNASRTMLYNIYEGRWSRTLCKALGIPMQMLPEVLANTAEFGETDPALFGAPLPIRGVAGDQQAAAIGQACFEPGMMKSTYGTGCFLLLNTGEAPMPSTHRLLTTIAYEIGGKRTFALEGSIFVAGAVVQWLRDGLKIIDSSAQTSALAREADPGQEVYFVPAFTGLGAPYWDADCRGAIMGLTRSTGPAEITRAALESVAFQTRDLQEAMRRDAGPVGEGQVLRVDGGMAANDLVLQGVADITGLPVDRPVNAETTVMGAGWLAGHQAGLWGGPETMAEEWHLDRRFEAQLGQPERDRRYAGWQDAVSRVLSHRD